MCGLIQFPRLDPIIPYWTVHVSSPNCLSCLNFRMYPHLYVSHLGAFGIFSVRPLLCYILSKYRFHQSPPPISSGFADTAIGGDNERVRRSMNFVTYPHGQLAWKYNTRVPPTVELMLPWHDLTWRVRYCSSYSSYPYPSEKLSHHSRGVGAVAVAGSHRFRNTKESRLSNHRLEQYTQWKYLNNSAVHLEPNIGNVDRFQIISSCKRTRPDAKVKLPWPQHMETSTHLTDNITGRYCYCTATLGRRRQTLPSKPNPP